MISRRLARRLVQHHLPIGAATAAAGYILYVTRPFSDVMTRLSFSSAYPQSVFSMSALGQKRSFGERCWWQ
jgi:hypothetical protein